MTKPGGFVAGDILGAADMNLLPGGVMGYAEVTANQTSIGITEVDLTSLTVTWTAVSSRRYRTSFVTSLEVNTLGSDTFDVITVYITDGSNTKKQTCDLAQPHATNSQQTLVGSVVETGLSGSTTRKLRGLAMDTNAGTTLNATLLASATAPCYILVEDIGPA